MSTHRSAATSSAPSTWAAKRIAGFVSECMLLGAVSDDGVVPLLRPDDGARRGDPVA
jgi:hypothetical protein